MVIRSAIRPAVRSPLRGALESRFGQDNGLSITAPSAVLFADGDQPIELWDYEAHNLLSYNEDFTNYTDNLGTAFADQLWYRHNGEVIVTANTIEDASNDDAPDWLAQFTAALDLPTGEYYFFSFDVLKDVGYNAVVMFQIDGAQSSTQIWFDPADGGYEYWLGSCAPCFDFNVADNTTYWTLSFVMGPSTANPTLTVFPAWGANQTLSNGEAPAMDSYALNAAVETVQIDNPVIRFRSSPATYVSNAGVASAPTASYGDIQFADTQYDSGSDSYKVNLDIADGDMTLQTVAGLTFTPTTGGDGSADASMEFTGTLAACLAALRGISVDNVAVGTVDLDVLITHVASGRTASKTISVGSVAALTSTAINDSTAIGAVLDTVTSLPGATYSIINADQIYRPLISNIVAAETSDTTATIDLDIWMRETTAGTLWWYVGTSATRPSVTDLKAGTGAAASDNQAISNSGTSAAEAQSQISVTGLSASTAYYVHVYCEDANGASTDIASRQPDPVSFTTEVASGVAQTSQLTGAAASSSISTTNATNDTITPTGANWTYARGSVAKTSGKRYFEVVYNEGGSANHNSMAWGLTKSDDYVNTSGAGIYWNTTAYGWTYVRPSALPTSGNGDAAAYANNSSSDWNYNSVTPTAMRHPGGGAKIFAFAVDLDTGEAWFGHDTGGGITWFGDPAAGTGEAFTDFSTGENTTPVIGVFDSSNSAELRTGTDTCSYSPPSGFVVWDAT